MKGGVAPALIVQFFFLSAITLSAHANSYVLSNFIEKDTVLESGTYIIDNNVKVSKGATLTVNGGSRILFRKGASVKVEGGLFLDGRVNNFIDISSENIESEGFGFIFSGANNSAEIIISHTQFSYLLVPLNFEKNWARKVVIIKNNIFEHIMTGEAGIVIKNPDEITSKGPFPFSFSNNIFAENNSSIFIESPESDVLILNFNYNLITSNYFFGFETGAGANAPVSVLFDNKKLKYKGDFTGNSFFNNYLLNDTSNVIIREINFGIRGRGETFVLDSNYFGNKSVAVLQNSFDHSNNYRDAPYISVNKPMPCPSDSAHGHIWKIIFNGKELTSFDNFPEINDPSVEIVITFNRPLFVRGGIQFLSYSYFDEVSKKIITKNVTCTFKIDKANKTLSFLAKDIIYLKYKKGFFTIDGLNDDEGFGIPAVIIGKEYLKTFFINDNIRK